MPVDNPPLDHSALDAAARQIGDRWTLRVIGALLDHEATFGELSSAVDGIVPTILTARLRSLQRSGLVVATPYERRPLRMRYGLTEAGRQLGSALVSLATWGAERDGRAPDHVHAACGTPIETRPWCPTCERVVDTDAVDAVEPDHLIWC